MGKIEDRLFAIIDDTGFRIIESHVIAGRKARQVTVPSRLEGSIKVALQKSFQNGLYSHQKIALEHFLDGHDICLATPTASGKSLVFIYSALHLLMTDPQACVMALYPAKALIQDQLTKWKSALADFKLAPGYIDGAVNVDLRPGILKQHRVVLMTPDVAHAWLLSHLNLKEVRSFLKNTRLLVMDEAHVYDGVFGTNMAYFIRRLMAVAPIQQVITSTATIGEPIDFIKLLTGRTPRLVGDEMDGYPSPPKNVYLVRPNEGKSLDRSVELICGIARTGLGRFLAFADSRKMVEQVVSIAARSNSRKEDLEEDSEGAEPPDAGLAGLHILPYRAGYEEEDRRDIQRALVDGSLAGVVSTSALELGLDIGEIDLVIMLGTPPTVKSFWQRLGRAGRRQQGHCLLIDDKGTISASPKGLRGYLENKPETGWLYLDNQYIQYAHALCAAQELSEAGTTNYQRDPLRTLPDRFNVLFENEINPTEGVPDDLFPLKQRAQAGPHYEFPIRSGIEKNFAVRERSGPVNTNLGTLTYSQALREGYPGAIYYYMARPYRVILFNHRTGEIWVRREKRWTTRPILQNMVFPKLPGGVLNCLRSGQGFVAETEIQVSERVLGFTEQRGPNKFSEAYATGSAFSQRPISRFFETTGVCWYFNDDSVLTEDVGKWLLNTFCALCGVQERDLALGTFHAKSNELWQSDCRGYCIYDAVHGSLRLSKQLAARFVDIVVLAEKLLLNLEEKDRRLEESLWRMQKLTESLSRLTLKPSSEPTQIAETGMDWVKVITPNQRAMLLEDGVTDEVEVLAYRYTPQGLMYQLRARTADVVWMVRAGIVKPFYGETKLLEVNLITGETREIQTQEV